MFGGSGILVSLLHFRRNESDRLFAALCLTVNGCSAGYTVALDHQLVLLLGTAAPISGSRAFAETP
jgi:hypothetical protein